MMPKAEWPKRKGGICVVMMSDEPEDLKIGQGLPRSASDLLEQADPPLGVNERPFLLSPGRGRQEQVLVEGTYFLNRLFATAHFDEADNFNRWSHWIDSKRCDWLDLKWLAFHI